MLGLAVLRRNANQLSQGLENEIAHGKHVLQPQSTTDSTTDSNTDWPMPQFSLEPESSDFTSSYEQHPPMKFPISSTPSHAEPTSINMPAPSTEAFENNVSSFSFMMPSHNTLSTIVASPPNGEETLDEASYDECPLWPFSDFVHVNSNQYSSFMESSTPSIAVATSASRSPLVTGSILVNRPPSQHCTKATTDFLEAWFNRHSDHPYPSEEEAQQLCRETGRSMSQVFNWMISVSFFNIYYPCVTN